jgi:sugar/nucleoside kinase (ribokinase family)
VGGSATYASLTAASLAPVRVVAVVGDDFPLSMLDAMQARGIDTRGVQRVAGKTFRWSGRYHEDLVGRDTLDTQLNVFADFRPVLPEAYRDTPLLLLGNIHPDLQLDVLDAVADPRFVVADTMNFWIEGQRAALDKVVARIDALVINDEEARLLSGKHNIVAAAKHLMASGLGHLIIKRGEHGALYFSGDEVFACPALPLEQVADPTGAGDCVAGGLLAYLATQDHIDQAAMRRAILRGTAAASFCVQAVGTGGVRALDVSSLRSRVAEIHALCHVEGQPPVERCAS